eukprot:11245059-Ditylum_brightwellii.AAC.1
MSCLSVICERVSKDTLLSSGALSVTLVSDSRSDSVDIKDTSLDFGLRTSMLLARLRPRPGDSTLFGESTGRNPTASSFVCPLSVLGLSPW